MNAAHDEFQNACQLTMNGDPQKRGNHPVLPFIHRENHPLREHSSNTAIIPQASAAYNALL